MADRRTEDPGTVRGGAGDLSAGSNETPSSPVRRDLGDSSAGTTGQDKATGKERFAAALTRSQGSSKKADKGGAASAAAASTGQSTGTATSTSPSKAPKRVRKAHLRLTHVDPWSVMKTSFLFSIAIGIVWVVAVAVVWAVLGAAGIWESIDSTVADVVGQSGDEFRIEDYLGMSRVMGFTMIVAVVDVVLVTVIGTLGAFLYNLAAALLGGVEVVLAEDDR